MTSKHDLSLKELLLLPTTEMVTGHTRSDFFTLTSIVVGR